MSKVWKIFSTCLERRALERLTAASKTITLADCGTIYAVALQRIAQSHKFRTRERAQTIPTVVTGQGWWCKN